MGASAERSSEHEQPLAPASSHPSRLGKASFVLGATGLVMILIFPCGYFGMGASEWSDEGPIWGHASVVLFAMGLLSFYVSPALGLVGSCLALAALLRKNRRRGVSISGLILNVTTLLAFGLLLLWLISMMEGVGAG